MRGNLRLGSLILCCLGVLLAGGCVRLVVQKNADGTTNTTVEVVTLPTSAPAGQAPQSTPQSQTIAEMEAQCVQLINRERETRGQSTLAVNTTLTKVAREYSEKMGREDFFSHYDAQNKSVADRIEAAGISYRMVGENLFKSLNSPDPVPLAVDGWMKSKEHRDNILTPKYSQTGIGIWRKGNLYYFTQIFLLPR